MHPIGGFQHLVYELDLLQTIIITLSYAMDQFLKAKIFHIPNPFKEGQVIIIAILITNIFQLISQLFFLFTFC